jgi:hypothetical protein
MSNEKDLVVPKKNNQQHLYDLLNILDHVNEIVVLAKNEKMFELGLKMSDMQHSILSKLKDVKENKDGI